MSDDRGWRVGHQGRDRMYYEERHGGAWERIDIDGEMLMGKAHHVIYFASPARWREYPPWARDRRPEIIQRITSEFRPPEYEYHGLDVASTPANTPAAPAAPPGPPAPSIRKASPVQGSRALLLVVVLLFAMAAATGWLAIRGIQKNETTIPLPRSSVRRTVERDQDRVMYWVSIGIYATLATGTFTLGVLGARALRRLGR
jgi:hypothetical protein